MNSFNPELQLQNTKPAMRNKLKYFLTELKGFKFVITMVLEFKNQKVMMKQNIAPFIHPQRLKPLLRRVILMYLSQYSV